MICAPGIYHVTITGTTCTVVQTFTITDHPSPTINLVASDSLNCDNPEIQISNISDDEDYIYEWSTGSMDHPLTVSIPDLYIVTVTDTITGCSSLDSLNTVTNAICNVGTNFNGDDWLSLIHI